MQEECDCLDCCGGTQGPQGSKGPLANAEGFVGPQGYVGFQTNVLLMQGFQGNEGTESLENFSGPQGQLGWQGQNVDGVQGPSGFQGSWNRGAQGQPGFLGAQGFVGNVTTGPQGFAGNGGPQGFMGTQGPQPATPGAQGAVGAQGAKGNWPNNIYATFEYYSSVPSSSTILIVLLCPPVPCMFTFSCMSYCTPGTFGNLDIEQQTLLSRTIYQFPSSYALTDRIPVSVSVLVDPGVSSSPIVVTFKSYFPSSGIYLNMESLNISFVQVS